MPIDHALEDAIFEAAEEAGQPRSVALRMVAWLKALSEGGSSEDQDRSFYGNVMAAIELTDERNAD